MGTFEKAREFIYRNARPLDLARWQYHFENGSGEAVLHALSYYQNEDGGFGHALEADAWNPHSSPIQTWTATELLREVGMTDSAHPVMAGILRYLEAGRDFREGVWLNTVPGNNDYPHAPWWHSPGEGGRSYNPTACLAGFLVRFADRGGELYARGCRIAREAYDAYMGQGLLDDMHTVRCYIRLMQYLEEAGGVAGLDGAGLKAKLIEQVRGIITRNTADWETAYVCTPSWFIDSPESVFYPGNEELARFECGYIVRTQREDGSWDIPWGWGSYAEEWALSKNWWKANGIIANLLYLRGFGVL